MRIIKDFLAYQDVRKSLSRRAKNKIFKFIGKTKKGKSTYFYSLQYCVQDHNFCKDLDDDILLEILEFYNRGLVSQEAWANRTASLVFEEVCKNRKLARRMRRLAQENGYSEIEKYL